MSGPRLPVKAIYLRFAMVRERGHVFGLLLGNWLPVALMLSADPLP